MEANVNDGLDEGIWLDKVRTVTHVRSFVIEGDLGRNDPVYAHEGLAHRQGTPPSRHPFDVERHGLGGEAQVLVGN